MKDNLLIICEVFKNYLFQQQPYSKKIKTILIEKDTRI